MKTKRLYYAAAATTAIAGILHLTLAPNMLDFNPNGAILFFVGGIAQIFWALPMLRRWGTVWYGIGIGGTLVLIAIWIITRMPGNPITGRGGMVNEMGIAVEALEWAFVGLTAGIMTYESKRKRLDRKTLSDAT
jgi:peptidoglycan/LPS O-acetylase OafA/YrhL